jgi:hypothetical protein
VIRYTGRVPPPPDKPPESVALTGDGRVRIALPDHPGVLWTVRVAIIDGQPYVTELHYRAAATIDPRTVALDHRAVTGLPLRRLAKIAAQVHNLGPDGKPRREPADLWQVLAPATPLGRRPDRRRIRRHPDDYAREMTDWSAPVADIVRTAQAQGRPTQQAVADAYGVTTKRAEQLISVARQYHGLAKQPRPTRKQKTDAENL